MGENRRKPRQEPDTPSPQTEPKVKEYIMFNWLSRIFPKLNEHFGEGSNDDSNEGKIPVRYFYYVGWIVILLVAYERLGYMTEKNIRVGQKLKKEVENYRAEYTSVMAEYMKRGKQSEIAQKVLADSLKESVLPPYKLVVSNNELK